jgi:SAM-dependent methyltransferase
MSGVDHRRLREIMSRCLAHDLPPTSTLAQMLIAAEDVDLVAEALRRTARAADPSARAQLRRLTRLLAKNAAGMEKIAAMLRGGLDHSAPPQTAESGIEAWRAAFDRSVRECPEASVALYSLGNPRLLAAATAEITAKMRGWGLIGKQKHLLEIGCGIGRFASVLADEVATFTGIDISHGMIEAARRRCTGLSNVRLLACTGHDLAMFERASFDVILAIDTFPYLVQCRGGLIETHLAESARVLRPGGELLVLNYSYRDDFTADATELGDLGRRARLTLTEALRRPFATWDGTAFRLGVSS